MMLTDYVPAGTWMHIDVWIRAHEQAQIRLYQTTAGTYCKVEAAIDARLASPPRRRARRKRTSEMAS